jgi:hypothetical protein
MAAWHWGGDGSVVNNPLAAGSTPLYLYLPPVRGYAGGDLFPHYMWMHMETSDKHIFLMCKHRQNRPWILGTSIY